MALYKAAGEILMKVEEKKGSVKALSINSKHKNTKQIYALVVETLKYKSVLEDIISTTKLLQGTHLSKHEAQVLVYDFLLGKGLQCGGRYKKIMHSRKSQLNSALTIMKVKRKVMRKEDLISDTMNISIKLPKYLRINTLLTCKGDVLEYFRKIGYTHVSFKAVSQMKKKEFMIDDNVPNLLIFHPNVDLHDDRLYQLGEIIFQDKASCLPAYILSPKPGSFVIDACAAPGNKTSHLAALMSNKGTIFAFDKSVKRLSVMDSMLLKAGVLCCKSSVQDFLMVEHNDPLYGKVTHILLDPSCSGSGIVSRLNPLTDDDASSSEKRIKSLSNFQFNALNHALRFPKVSKVVYSTCSVHQTENEDVVRRALLVNTNFHLVNVMPEWKTRGIASDEFPNGDKCIRCNPDSNDTNGFFVALLERGAMAEPFI